MAVNGSLASRNSRVGPLGKDGTSSSRPGWTRSLRPSPEYHLAVRLSSNFSGTAAGMFEWLFSKQKKDGMIAPSKVRSDAAAGRSGLYGSRAVNCSRPMAIFRPASQAGEPPSWKGIARRGGLDLSSAPASAPGRVAFGMASGIPRPGRRSAASANRLQLFSSTSRIPVLCPSPGEKPSHQHPEQDKYRRNGTRIAVG